MMQIATYESKEKFLLCVCVCVCVCVLVTQLCPTVCNSMDWTLQGFSVLEILQARMLGWGAIPFSRGSSWPRDCTQASCMAGRFLTVWDTREALYLVDMLNKKKP